MKTKKTIDETYYSTGHYSNPYKNLSYANASPDKRYIKILKFFYDNGESDKLSAVGEVFADNPTVARQWASDNPRHNLRDFAVTYFGQLVNDGLLDAKKKGKFTLFTITDKGKDLLAKCGVLDTAINESFFGIFAAPLILSMFKDERSKSYFRRNKIGSYDNNDNQLDKEKAAKRQREWEEWRKKYHKQRQSEKEAASKEPRLAIRLALPPYLERLPHEDRFFFVTCEKNGEYENARTGSDALRYPDKPFNIFTIYGPLSQLQKVFNLYSRMFFAYDLNGNKIYPNPSSIDKCLVDANGNDLTFYLKAE